MTFEHFLAFNFVLFLSMLSPGPALLMVSRQALEQGFVTGAKTGIGLGLVASFWTLMALVGLDVLFQVFPVIYSTAKIAGALLLLYFAFTMWQSAGSDISERPALFKHPIALGMATNAVNPKSVLFASSVLIVIFPKDMSYFKNALIVGTHFIMEVSFYTSLAFGLSRGALAERYISAKRSLDRIFAGVLASLGLYILLSERNRL